MKKKVLGLMLGLALVGSMLGGCGSSTDDVVDNGNNTASDSGSTVLDNIAEPIDGGKNDTNENEADNTNDSQIEDGIVYISDLTAPEGYAYSTLTGELISEDIVNQRPLAVMVDNEITALDHYGVNDCDIVYECMNSTLNGRITRLMCIIQDYDSIEQLGSIRSARTVNIMLSAEWNAILCHDGGPFYINEYYASPQFTHLNGVFSRVNNGKATEFTEYVLAKDVDKYLGSNANFDTEFNKYYTGAHFEFVESGALGAGTYPSSKDANKVELPFTHNKSQLRYNEETGLYEYVEYGSDHVDAATGEVTAFKNVIIQCADFEEYDENGYLYYKIAGNNDVGYYLTDGKAVPITWSRGDNLEDNTVYYDSNNNPIYLNVGKTYITLVPKDTWDEVVISK